MGAEIEEEARIVVATAGTMIKVKITKIGIARAIVTMVATIIVTAFVTAATIATATTINSTAMTPNPRAAKTGSKEDATKARAYSSNPRMIRDTLSKIGSRQKIKVSSSQRRISTSRGSSK